MSCVDTVRDEGDDFSVWDCHLLPSGLLLQAAVLPISRSPALKPPCDPPPGDSAPMTARELPKKEMFRSLRGRQSRSPSLPQKPPSTPSETRREAGGDKYEGQRYRLRLSSQREKNEGARLPLGLRRSRYPAMFNDGVPKVKPNERWVDPLTPVNYTPESRYPNCPAHWCFGKN
jgi:hypothetical protein